MNDSLNHAKQCIEPLADLAQFAWDSAPKLCKPEHGCVDYHRSWGLVRLLLGNGRLPAGEDFFQRELARIVSNGGRRVLVSGGADSGLTTIVLNACRAAGVEPDIVFADRCATACELNARMADAVHANIQVVEGDVCDLDVAPVDAVIAHSFLPFFESDKRQDVLGAWFRSCKVGGEVLISNVLKGAESDWMTHKSTEALKERADKLLRRAKGAAYPVEVAQEMVHCAARFWRISPGRPPGLTESNLRAGLERAGFKDISIQYNDAGVNDGPMAMVRQQIEGKGRAEILAIKSNY